MKRHSGKFRRWSILQNNGHAFFLKADAITKGTVKYWKKCEILFSQNRNKDILGAEKCE